MRAETENLSAAKRLYVHLNNGRMQETYEHFRAWAWYSMIGNLQTGGLGICHQDASWDDGVLSLGNLTRPLDAWNEKGIDVLKSWLRIEIYRNFLEHKHQKRGKSVKLVRITRRTKSST